MQRVIKRILIAVGIVLIVVVMLHVALFAFINTKGRDLIITGLKENLDLEATMDSLSLEFPFNVEIKNFKCEALSFKQGNVSLGFFNPFTHKISLNKIYLDGLDVKVAEDKQGVSISQFSQGEEKMVLFQDDLSLSKLDTEAKPEKKEERPESKEKKFSLAIGNLYLKNSRIEVEYPIKERPFNIVFSDLSLRIKGFTYPKLSRFYVKLDTIVVSPLVESQKANSLGVKGWVDYNNKNMDVEINIDNLDYFTFAKTYPPFWRPNNLRLKESGLSFKSNFKSKDNELTIDNLLTIESVKFIEEEGEGESFQAKTLKTIISFLKGDKDKPTLHFKLMTSMDSPKLDFSLLKDRLMGAAGIGPMVIIEGAADKIKEQIKNLGSTEGENVGEVLRGITKNLEGIFKIDDSEQSQENKEDAPLDDKTP